MHTLSEQELEILEEKYQDNWSFMVKLAVGFALGGFILILIPLDIMSKARRGGISGNAVDNLGFLGAVGVMVCLFGSIWAVLYYFNIYGYKRDLAVKEKIVAEVEVEEIEHLSAELSAQMQNNYNKILHFKKNNHNVKDFYFNSRMNPEYINAKKMYIERAKYSKEVLNSKVIV